MSNLEELDRENAQLLVSLSRDPAYIQRNEEIISLAAVQELDEELISDQPGERRFAPKLLIYPSGGSRLVPPSTLSWTYSAPLPPISGNNGLDTILPDAYGETPASNTGELRDMKERYDHMYSTKRNNNKQYHGSGRWRQFQLWMKAKV